MAIAQHKNASTTAAIRAEVAASGACAATPGQRFDITEATVYKWKKRTRVHDVSITQHSLQSTLARIVLGCADGMENKAVPFANGSRLRPSPSGAHALSSTDWTARSMRLARALHAALTMRVWMR